MKTTIVLCAMVMAAVASPAELYRAAVYDNTIPSGFSLSNVKLPVEDLGLLKAAPLPISSDVSAIMFDLLPEFTEVLKKFGAARSTLSPAKAVSTFFPIVRAALEKKAKNEGRSLSDDEKRKLTLSETSINLSTDVLGKLSTLNSNPFNIITDVMAIVKPIMDINAASENRTLTEDEKAQIKQIEGISKFTVQTMKDLETKTTVSGMVASNLRLARAVMESNARAQGKWGIDWKDEQLLNNIADTINMSLEVSNSFQTAGTSIKDMIPTFMKLSNFIYNTRAAHEGRGITWEEQKELRFTETTLRAALGFSQELADGTATDDSINRFVADARSLMEQRRTNSY